MSDFDGIDEKIEREIIDILTKNNVKQFFVFFDSQDGKHDYHYELKIDETAKDINQLIYDAVDCLHYNLREVEDQDE